MKRKAKTNTNAEPGFIKRRNRISGQFRAHSIEMLESPAWKVLSLNGRRVVDRVDIELAHHGGNDNGQLPVTYEDFVEYGVSGKRHVAPAIREAEALGFIRVTEHGRGGNAEYRQPNLFFVTYARARNSHANPPTDDWRKIKTIEEAEKIAAAARSNRSPRAVAHGKWHRKKQNADAPFDTVSVPQRGTGAHPFPVPQRGTTGSVPKGVLLSRSWVGDTQSIAPEPIPEPGRHSRESLMDYVASVIRQQLDEHEARIGWVDSRGGGKWGWRAEG
jgi:hypothetical protein